MLPPLRLVGADILRGAEIRQRSVAIEAGRITKGPLPAADFSGHFVLPGIVDLHADYSAPPCAELGASIRASAARAAAAGITTQWLAHGWSWEGGSRSPARAQAWLAAMAQARHLPIDLRPKLLADSHLIDDDGALLAAVRKYRIGLVSFANVAAGVIEMARSQPEALSQRAKALGTTPATLAAGAARALSRSRDVPRHLCKLADAFDPMGVVYASHGDPNAERREFHSMLGARIAECPACYGAASAARAMGNPVLVAAPGREPSLPGLPGAFDLAEAKLVDMLVSAAHPENMAQSAFRLADEALADLPLAWAMLSERPAELMGLVDRGTLDYGRRADLVIICQRTRRIEATIAAGRLAFATPEAKGRINAAFPRNMVTAPGFCGIAAQ